MIFYILKSCSFWFQWLSWMKWISYLNEHNFLELSLVTVYKYVLFLMCLFSTASLHYAAFIDSILLLAVYTLSCSSTGTISAFILQIPEWERSEIIHILCVNWYFICIIATYVIEFSVDKSGIFVNQYVTLLEWLYMRFFVCLLL